MPKCPKCENSVFVCERGKVLDYNFEVNFIQCGKCQTVVGVLPLYDAGFLAHKNDQTLQELVKQVADLAQRRH